MIAGTALQALIRTQLPDADVGIVDRTGTMDHFNLTIRSRAFKGKTLLEQHRLVYGALEEALRDGRVHAVELKTIVAES
ncbi:MAG: BolA family transcriptional regulator [Candidatus Eremiobacteraeota bacterium]|nr:BolA family transcriptional regulator [Candidatus Eremiobacteraeota bacterium]MBV9055478.1 BolA family transcriptional regulator [Candidatus Eremiobacteraeota bacterium]MBV9700078.1 BolA family transcriptional regulator [Candidatus Eremiobacteraeota bacterium]